MTKAQFIVALHSKLINLPRKEVEESLNFYSEMIDDRMEEGCTEEEAVAAVGNVDAIVSQITRDISASKLVKQKVKPRRRLKTWEIVLLALGSPLWLSLLLALAAVAISMYVAFWAVIVAVWAVFLVVGASAVGCLAGGIVQICLVQWLPGCALIGTGLVNAGLTVGLFFGSKYLTRSVTWMANQGISWVKSAFAKKEAAK